MKIILTFPSIWNVSPFLKFPIYFFSQCIYADQNYLEEFHQFLESNNQRAKKVVSDSPGLVDFAIGLVIFVLNLPDGQVLFFPEIQITEGL